MPAPKPMASPEQLKLQDQLIAACKQGDEKMATALLKQGAKPDMSNAKDEQPLGAAVWGMCPDVVNALLKQAGGVAPMTWDECETHNLTYYKEMFIVPKFGPQTYGEWYQLLQKMDPNPFIRAYHLKKADEQWHQDVTSTWEKWKNRVQGLGGRLRLYFSGGLVKTVCRETEMGYVGFRTQIKQEVEAASHQKVLPSSLNNKIAPLSPTQTIPFIEKNPTEIKISSVTKTTTNLSHPLASSPSQSSQILMPAPKPTASPAQLKLQDQLIATCKQGDEKAVTALLQRGAKPDMPDAKGEQPLGAAVWGMCPDVVNALLKQAGGVAPMTWEECEKHNLKYYKEVFIVPKFDPQTYGEWYPLLQKMDPNPFIRAVHLKKADAAIQTVEKTR